MRKETSQWSKDVRKAVIDKDMTLKQLAESIGYSYAVVSSVINGRYSNASYQAIAEKIRERMAQGYRLGAVQMPRPGKPRGLLRRAASGWTIRAR